MRHSPVARIAALAWLILGTCLTLAPIVWMVMQALKKPIDQNRLSTAACIRAHAGELRRRSR